MNSGNQPTSGNVGSVRDVSGMVENVGVAVWSFVVRSLHSIVNSIVVSLKSVSFSGHFTVTNVKYLLNDVR